MKKVLFLLGAFAAMSLVACSGKTDCACDLVNNGVDPDYLNVSHTEANGSLDVLEFDGDCKDVKWSDLPSSSANWASMSAFYTLKCAEK